MFKENCSWVAEQHINTILLLKSTYVGTKVHRDVIMGVVVLI